MRVKWRVWQDDRVVVGLLMLVSLGGIALYLLHLARVTAPGLPFDDAWIHLTLSRNLADSGAMGINAGRWSGGSSSLLWDLLLAAIRRLSGFTLEAALALGAVSHALSAALFYRIARDSLGQAAGLLAGALLAFSGPLVFLGLSGMETSLFVLLGMAALWCWAHGRPGASGLFLALLLLTRIEGLLLWGLLLTHYVLWGRRTARRGAGWWAFLPTPIAFLLSGLLRLAMEGQFLPLTMAGRRWLWGMAPSPFPLWPADWGSMHQYLKIWQTYLLDWLFQAFRLEPLPALAWAYRGLWIALLVGGAVFIGRLSWRDGREIRWLGAVGLVLWGLAHWALYLLLAPVATLRHQVLVLPGLFLLAAAGMEGLRGLLRRRTRAPALPWAVWGLGACGLLLWNGVTFRQWQVNYADHVRHINQVHARLGQWVAANLPQGAVVAAFDIGAISYLGQREVVDLGGLTDAAFLPQVYAGDVLPYLRTRGVTHLAMIGYPDDYWWHQLGLVRPAWGEEFNLERLQDFDIAPYADAPFDRPADYYYYPASLHIAVYAVEWLAPPPGGGASPAP